MRYAKRMQKMEPYFSVGLQKKIAEMRSRGEDIVSFAVGDPDSPTPENITGKLCEAAREPESHRYPTSKGTAELRQAIAEWYRRRFDVELDPETEVVPLVGAKEGIAHIALCCLDPGDFALVPDPGYPVYSFGTQLAGGRPYYLNLKEENGFLPDLNLRDQVMEKVKMLWLNYPNNPTGAVADTEFFNKAAAFARENDILVCHDAPYTEVYYDGNTPVSYLQAEGAKDTGIEFHSFSKTYNMAGWRIGMAAGNAEAIEMLKTLKTNIDSGIPPAIQSMAVEALQGPQDCIGEHNTVYQRRRDLICEVLSNIGLKVTPPRAGLYIWAGVPEGYNSVDLAEDLLEQVGVAVTPGIVYGRRGEGYVRLSLTVSDASLVKGLSRLSGWRNTRYLTPKR